MSPYLVIPLVALLASGLTLFSGFGLGTLLMPAFALFFPLEVAVAMTAVVHLANNLFKLALLGRHADRTALLRFGLPAIAGALLGAALLVALSSLPALHRYELAGRPHEVTGVKLVIALLMLGFAWAELDGRLERRAWPARVLPLGGLLSGLRLAVCEIGGFEAAGVVFVLGLVLVVGGLGVGGEGSFSHRLDLSREVRDELFEQGTFGHAWG